MFLMLQRVRKRRADLPKEVDEHIACQDPKDCEVNYFKTSKRFVFPEIVSDKTHEDKHANDASTAVADSVAWAQE